MKLPKVSVDLPLVLDPHKLILLLGGLDTAHSEIFVPDSLRFIEMWSKDFPMVFTLHVFDDPTFDERFDTKFGFEKNKITPDNFCAGLRLLKFAHDKGMINIFPAGNYEKLGREILRIDGYYPEFYQHNLSSGKTITINPDIPITLEALIGAEEKLGVKPIFGDMDFLSYIQKINPHGKIRGQEGTLNLDEKTSLLLECPEAVSFEELVWFVQNRNIFNEVSDKLKYAEDRKRTPKELGIMGLKFGGGLVVDAAVFGGLPITSGTIFTYELVTRILRVTTKRNG